MVSRAYSTALRAHDDPQPLIVITAAAAGAAAMLLCAGRWIAASQPTLDASFSEEGGLLEWVAFLSLLFAGTVLCWIHRMRRERDGLRWGAPKSVGMLILAAILLVGALEEISWGQHILGWKAPGFFRTRNIQLETNIHNLEILGVRLNTVVFDRLLFAVVGLHNVVLPLAALRKPCVGRWVERWGGFLPPLPLVIVFLVASALAQVIGIRRPAELPEAVGALHYLASVLATYGLGHGMEDAVARTASARRRAAPIVALSLLALIAVAALLTATHAGSAG